LVSGKVKIKKSMDTSEEGLIYLLPGQELIYNKNTHETRVEKFDVQRTLAWKDGIIIFKDAGFEEMIIQLERWYGVDFQIHGKPSKIWNINGRYQNEKLENILISLNFVYDLEYDIQGKNITLKLK
jgi:ferric-dicitrate binding protein FerR (iron transport regulator)